MSVIVEFTLEDEEFAFGRMLSAPPGMEIEFERIVPTGTSIFPFLWVRGPDHEAFEERVRANEHVAEFVALDRPDEWVLYRLDWTGDPGGLIHGLSQTHGTILEARGNDTWTFRMRFPDHDRVSQFYNWCTDNDIPIHIERSYTLTARAQFGHKFDLSQPQREALVLGLQRGYFETPRRTSLSDLAEELGISQQATSDRIRRGTEQVLTEALLSSAADWE